MWNHPGNIAPTAMGAPHAMAPSPVHNPHMLGAAPHPAPALMPQRQALSTGLERQKVLANALRGGMAAGVPQAAPHPLVQHAGGLPGLK